MYTPQNVDVYLRAFSGFMAGITSSANTDVFAGDYASAGQMADAWSQALDIEWGSSQPTILEQWMIATVSEEIWSKRSPLPLPQGIKPGAYVQVALSVVARVQQGNAQVVAEGIDPNGGGTPGTGTVTSVSGGNGIKITGAPSVSPGVELDPTGAAQSDVWVYDTSGAQFDLRQLTEDDILPGFAISSFTGGSTVEVGATVTNPAFVAAYNSLPSSASITNSDAIDSPLVLISPFTNGTIVGAFTHAAQATVTVTLTALKGGVTKTANSNINFFPRTFGGVGTAGAVSAVAAGNNATLNGGLGTLTNEGLFSTIVGQVFGPFNPSTQNIYILCPHTGSPHTWKDQNGFSFAMNAPTTFAFTNQNGAVISYDLYQSTNVLGSSFTLTVVT